MNTADTTDTAAGAASEHALRREIRSILAEVDLVDVRVRRDPRPVHRALGARGLLAPQWPVEYGGRGLSHVASAVLVEELVDHDIPDVLHTLTVQIVGSTLLSCAGPQLRERYLPGFAAGELFACVLFSERHAGSDLSSLVTRAVPEDPDRGAFRLYGIKTHSLFAGMADVGLGLARTGDGTTLTLFAIPMHAPGVEVRALPSLTEDWFHETTLNGVAVDRDHVVGELDQGWATLVRTLVYERTGLDYYVKARRWLREARRLLGEGRDETDAVDLARLSTRLDAAGVLVRRVLSRLDRGELGESEAAVAKWYTAELAAQLAWWSGDRWGDRSLVLGTAAGADAVDLAVRDAPTVRLSGGTSEMMLELIARLRLDAQVEVRV